MFLTISATQVARITTTIYIGVSHQHPTRPTPWYLKGKLRKESVNLVSEVA
jgi:hypothetical protein